MEVIHASFRKFEKFVFLTFTYIFKPSETSLDTLW